MPRKKTVSKKDLETIETLAGYGLKVEDIAHVLSMSKKTFERRVSESKKVSGALKKGRAIAGMQVAKTAYNMAVSGKVPAMTMFWLKCRQNWSEKNGFTGDAKIEDGKLIINIGGAKKDDIQA